MLSKSTGLTLHDHNKQVLSLSAAFSLPTDLTAHINRAIELHDIGKCTKEFQSELLNNTKRTTPHNMVSWAMIKEHPVVEHAVLFHHPIDTDMPNSVDILESVSPLIEVQSTENKVVPTFFSSSHSLSYATLKEESYKLITRTVVTVADRLASAGTQYNNEVHFTPIDTSKYDEKRLSSQLSIVEDISRQHTSIVGAAAGFGKTLIGLLYATRLNKKTLWVCPRNIIAENTYLSITQEAPELNVALLFTGEYIHGNEESDIIVTNIDNFLAPMTNNSLTVRSMNLLDATVIFDEFHEFVCSSPLFAAFVRILFARHNVMKSNTLLLSATPVLTSFLTDILNTPFGEKVFFKAYKSHLGENTFNITNNSNLPDTQILFNSVSYTQSYEEDVPMYHTRYTASDLTKKRSELLLWHGKGATNRNTVKGTRLIGTGLDISFSHLVESVCSPEHTLQAIGRVNRWGEVNGSTLSFVDYEDVREKGAIRSIYDNDLNKKWYACLAEMKGKSITLNEIYETYYKFNADNKEEISEYIKKKYRESSIELSKITPKRSIVSKSESKRITNKVGYRGEGDNYFIVAKNGNTWCEPIVVDSNIINKEEKLGKHSERVKSLKTMFGDYGWNKYMKLERKSFTDMKMMAKSANYPIPLNSFGYDEKKGLFCLVD